MIRSLIFSSSIIFAGAIISYLILGIDVTHAQGLVPPPGEDGLYGSCQLVQLAQNIINFLIYISIVFATLLFMWAGVLYITSGPNPDQISKAHKIFWNVLIGLIVVLGAWLIINTILLAIVSDSAERRSIAPWVSILCEERPRSTAPSSGVPGGGSLGVAPPGVTTAITNEQRIKDDEVREKIAFHNISVNKPVCPTDASTDCTDVWNLREETIQCAIAVSQACNCSTMLTGAGEKEPHAEGFFSHGEGYKLDYGRRSNPELFSWLDAGNEFPSCANPNLKDRGTSNEHWDLCVGCI